jgi:AcrR family transcriptional regulator
MSKQAKFDRDEVIEKAKNLYWQKGYHATSMRNLQDVVDMRPGSIYAAFGSKDNLFKEALKRYAEESSEQLALCMKDSPTVLVGLKQFIRNATIFNKDRMPSGMCMIVKTVSELTHSDSSELLASAMKILANIETEFIELFQQAIDLGEINADKDPVSLARYLQVQIIGLRTYSQINHDADALERLIDELFEKLFK